MCRVSVPALTPDASRQISPRSTSGNAHAASGEVQRGGRAHDAGADHDASNGFEHADAHSGAGGGSFEVGVVDCAGELVERAAAGTACAR